MWRLVYCSKNVTYAGMSRPQPSTLKPPQPIQPTEKQLLTMMSRSTCRRIVAVAAVASLTAAPSSAFVGPRSRPQQLTPLDRRPAARRPRQPLRLTEGGDKSTGDLSDDIRPTITAAAIEPTTKDIELRGSEEAEGALGSASEDASAATNTVNARLESELAAAAEAEKAGGKSKLSKRVRQAFKSEKTEEERQRSIEEAKDLNGINPLVAGGSGLVSWGFAFGLWTSTNFIAEVFAKNPVDTDIYTLTRLSGVFRNVVMGLFSLASGFAFVIGLGLVLLGGRVAVGIVTGELDPTPIRKKKGEELIMPNIMDLMMNKKPGRRGRKNGSDDNPFGL